MFLMYATCFLVKTLSSQYGAWSLLKALAMTSGFHLAWMRERTYESSS